MKIRNYLLASSVALLAACGGDNNKMTSGELAEQWAQAELFYSFPYHGQENVSLNAPLVLRFSDPIAGELSPSNIQLKCQEGPCEDNTTGQQGEVVQWRTGKPDIVDGNRGLILYTAHELMANSKYCVEFKGLTLTRGGANTPAEGFCFNTRVAPDKRGSLAEYGVADKLKVVRTFPDITPPDITLPDITGANTEPVMDFSTFRLRFNQPIKDSGVEYGKDKHVVLKQGEEVVDATLLVKRNLMTIAPKETLSPGKEYTLTIEGLEGLYNDDAVLSKVEYHFTPQDSQPRTILVQDTVEAVENGSMLDAPCNREGAKLSVLTDQPINCVPMESVLLGDKDSTMQYGDVFAELAFLPNFVEVSPLRVPRGSLLAGTNIDVRVAGIINPNGDGSHTKIGDEEIELTIENAAKYPGIMKTGKVSVSFISDATGYLYSNPYSTDPAAPKQVKLFMDLAMTAEGVSPNASLSQDLLHVELNGMASLDEKSMVIDAVGIVEPDVLGTEVAFGFLSFQMKSYPQSEMAEVFARQVDAREAWKNPNNKGPKPVSTFPEKFYEDGEAESFLLSDAITVHFNAPLDPDSIIPQKSFNLLEGGSKLSEEEIDWYLDGASFVVKPVNGFKSDTKYELEFTEGSGADTSVIRGLPFPRIKGVVENGAARKFFTVKEGGEKPDGSYYDTGELIQGKAIDLSEFEGLKFRTAKFDDVNGLDNFAYNGKIDDVDHQPTPFHYPAILTAYPGYPCAVTWLVGVGADKKGFCTGDDDAEASEVIIRPQYVPSNRPIRLTFSKPVHDVSNEAFKVFDVTNNDVQVHGKIITNGFDMSFIPNEPWKPNNAYKYVIKTKKANSCSESDGIICGKNGKPLMTSPLSVKVVKGGVDGDANQIIDESDAFQEESEMYFFGAHKTKTVFQALRNTPTLDPAAVMTYYEDMDKKSEIVNGGNIPNSTQLKVVGTTGGGGYIINDAKLGCLSGDCPANSYIHLAGNLNSEIFGPVKYECLFKDEEGLPKSYCETAEPLDVESFGADGVVELKDGEALAVGIYPTAILTGSADVFAHVSLLGSSWDWLTGWLVDLIAETKSGWLPSPTGVQIMRMHPAESLVEPESGNPIASHPLYKNNPNGLIPGWIRNTSEGPVFESQVNLYLDAPYLAVLGGEGTHNQRNYKLSLDLRGPVEFLGDGRIQIHQRNLNEAKVSVELDNLTLGTQGGINLKIPAGGAYMVYQGEPVKK